MKAREGKWLPAQIRSITRGSVGSGRPHFQTTLGDVGSLPRQHMVRSGGGGGGGGGDGGGGGLPGEAALDCRD